MIDTDAIQRMVEKQIVTAVNDQVLAALTSEEWLQPLEQKILKYSQDRILNKFANSSSMPEIVQAVKDSVSKLFSDGMIPGIEQFVDPIKIKSAVDQALEQFVQSAVTQFGQDPAWQERVERMINQTVVHETMARFGAIDLSPTIKKQVDENMQRFTDSILKNFVSTGIVDQASGRELTVMDDAVVVENSLIAKNVEAVDLLRVQNLVVTGSINTDNQSWSALASCISQQTLEQLTEAWHNNLVNQVAKQIQDQGISFEQIRIKGETIIEGSRLSNIVTESGLQSVGLLKNLSVRGEAHFNNNTLNVLNKRLGVNTDSPEMALSIWDEEVSIVIGKNKANEAYIGTNRDQGMTIGVNRKPQIEINTNGLTTVKKLQVGLHKISHDVQVPGWAGTRGDMVFNTNPGPDRVFAWVCLGAHKWQTLKSAE
jgi:hypothetical protein